MVAGRLVSATVVIDREAAKDASVEWRTQRAVRTPGICCRRSARVLHGRLPSAAP